MRIVCITYHLIGHAALSYLLDEAPLLPGADDQVVGVFTHEDDPDEEVWWPSVADLAEAHGVPVWAPEDINAPEWAQRLRDLEPDIVISGWYRDLLKRPILEVPPHGCLNLHGSLLPKYRGRAPVNWVLVNGESQTGMTLHYMVERADAGDIVGQVAVPIDLEDTALTLYHKLAAATTQTLRAAWPLLRVARAPRVPQDHSQATYFSRRTPEDGRFVWDWSALRIHNLVRAVTHPYPGAFTDRGDRRLFVWSARLVAAAGRAPLAAPGVVLAVSDAGIEVATGEGRLLLRRLQLEGEEELDATDFAAVHDLRAGQRLPD